MDTVKINSKKVKMIAHRGLSGIERENTCSAFVAAGNRSYFGIETDVHKTKDGKFVIIHDETTDRVSNGRYSINVEENDYSALEPIVLPDIDGSVNRRDIRIPLLQDYIKVCKKYGKFCVLEVKNALPEEDLKKMKEEIESADYVGNMIFISFSWENCIILRNLFPENDVQWLTGEDITEEVIKKLAENRMNLDVYYKNLTKKIVRSLHANGIKVNCWTCDDKADAERLVEFGVDFITSNILE